MSIHTITSSLLAKLDGMSFAPPVTHVYNPLEYARESHQLYLSRFSKPPKEVIFVGMNPGPWGMAQTGVPFGEIAAVRDWMGIEVPVGRPVPEHPKRPVMGFDCPRSEVSGARLWGWAQSHFPCADDFFTRFFVTNYCPLSFMEEGGKNRTPDKLPADEREPLFAACDTYLRNLVDLLHPKWVIGVGAFAEKRTRIALDERKVQIGRLLHPSPASPIANRGWAKRAMEDLRSCGVYF